MEGRTRSKGRIEIPEAVVEDILLKLPVKSLLRFRCVCKMWCSTFHTSYFITKHHQNNIRNNNLNLLLKSWLNSTVDDVDYFSALSTEKGDNFLVKENIHFPLFETDWHAPIVSGPCNGLFCLYYEGEAALWNPSTREFKFLPQSSVQRHPLVNFTSFGCLGFGFDSKTDDFKVVRFVTYYFDENEDESMLDDCIRQVELYSLKSDSWKQISCPEAEPYWNSSFNNYINGFYYWQAAGNSDCFVLSFDMANEKFSTLPFPEFGGSLSQCYLQLLDFNGSLGAIVYPKMGTEESFYLWVMNGSWTRKFSIESVSGVNKPLGFWKKGELFIESSNCELVLFDPALGELKNLDFHAHWKTMQLSAYFESLVPINGRSENEEQIIRQPGKKVASIGN
ncbi:hypothetical protein PTKIN_Ptkin11bG0063700 [Pterospermum kingtungense]